MHGHLNVNLSRCKVTWKSIYHDARSPEHQFITMQGHLKVNLSRCTVTWTSIYHDARSPERQFITMHGHVNVNLSRFTVTWTSIYHDARSRERQFITMQGHVNVNLSRCTATWTWIYHDARSPERQMLRWNVEMWGWERNFGAWIQKDWRAAEKTFRVAACSVEISWSSEGTYCQEELCSVQLTIRPFSAHKKFRVISIWSLMIT